MGIYSERPIVDLCPQFAIRLQSELLCCCAMPHQPHCKNLLSCSSMKCTAVQCSLMQCLVRPSSSHLSLHAFVSKLIFSLQTLGSFLYSAIQILRFTQLILKGARTSKYSRLHLCKTSLSIGKPTAVHKDLAIFTAVHQMSGFGLSTRIPQRRNKDNGHSPAL